MAINVLLCLTSKSGYRQTSDIRWTFQVVEDSRSTNGSLEKNKYGKVLSWQNALHRENWQSALQCLIGKVPCNVFNWQMPYNVFNWQSALQRIKWGKI